MRWMKARTGAMKNILIDTSAWIDFFRSSSDAVGDMVADLIRADRAFLTGPVIAELLHGVRGKKENNQLATLFAAIPYQATQQVDWIETGNSLQKLRRKGLAIPLTDVLISRIAIRNEMAVLTLDKHFQYLDADLLDIRVE